MAICVGLAALVMTLPSDTSAPIASGLRRTLMAPLVTVQHGAEQWRVAWLESERLALGRDSLAVEAADARSLRLENARLRDLLGLGGRLRWGIIPAEAMQTSARPDGLLTSLVLSAGSNAGVATFSPVVGPEGVIGMVQSVDPQTSVVMLFSNPDFRVSAETVDGSGFGIVYPHEGSGASDYLLELRNVVFRTQLRPGTEIITSGLGGTFPRGIPVGAVVAEIKASAGWSRTYLVRPAVNPANVTSVMVMTPERAAQDVGNAWATALGADSARERMQSGAAALARHAAELEAARHRAVVDATPPDSARADSVRRANGGGEQ
ncbi:MAG TPA: rod shape-determining protein MreC [Gemmatimonadaceae bacterium]|jgi:rod shape-determining protein MreC|nr:rod shape-determining protein MreC [Gemmatimonadaceae bacterium]